MISALRASVVVAGLAPLCAAANGGAAPSQTGAMPTLTGSAANLSPMALRCGQAHLVVSFAGAIARLRAGIDHDAPDAPPAVRGVLDLASQPAATVARFGTSDGATWLWSRGGEIAAQIDGVRLPDCVVAPSPLTLPVTARGNEPFWSVTVSSDRIVFTPMDGPGVTANTPLPQGAGAGWRYAPSGAYLAVTLRPRLCRDTMSGMPHPATAQVETGGRVLAGCAGAPADLLAGKTWNVFEVAGEAVPEGVAATIEFDASRKSVSGGSGCNRYAGGFSLSGEGLSFPGQLAATMMACPEPQMAFERRYLDALAGVDGFDVSEDGRLSLLRAGKPVIRARR